MMAQTVIQEMFFCYSVQFRVITDCEPEKLSDFNNSFTVADKN